MKSGKYFRIIFFFIALGLYIVTTAGNKWDDEADKRKADYLFMEALRQKSIDNVEPHLHLFKYAYDIDSLDLTVSQDLGYYYLVLAQNNAELAEKGYNMIKRYFNAHPEDYYSSIFYGQINDRLGDIEESMRVWHTLDSLFPQNLDVSLRYAQALASTMDSVNIRKSLKVFDRIERSTGKEVGLTSQRVISLMMLGDTIGIYNETSFLLEALPKSSDAREYAGDVYKALGNNEEALNFYNEACQLDSANGNAYFKRADLYRLMGDNDIYDKEVFHALTMPELDLDVKMDILKGYISNLYEDETQHKRITDMFDVLIEEHPHEVELRKNYVGFLWYIKDFDKAAEQMEYIVDLNPADVDQWRMYAGIFYDKKDYDEAVKICERALKFHPEELSLILLQGSALQLSKRYDEAIKLLESTYFNIDEKDIDNRMDFSRTIADLYQNEDNPDKAIEWYEIAYSLDPLNHLTLNNYAYFLACREIELDKAEQMISDVVLYEPTNTIYLDTCAWVMFKQKKYEKAKSYMDRALSHYEDENLSSEYFEHAGDIYFMNGLPDEALDYWQKALELDPDNQLLQKKVKFKTYFFK